MFYDCKDGRQKKETCQNETRPIHTNLVYWSHFRKETCPYENRPVHTNLVYWSHFGKETCPYENRPIHTHLAFWYHFTHQTHTTVSLVLHNYTYVYICISRVFISFHASDSHDSVFLGIQSLNSLQLTATHCNTLQHTATHCNTLQHTATCILGLPKKPMSPPPPLAPPLTHTHASDSQDNVFLGPPGLFREARDACCSVLQCVDVLFHIYRSLL